LDTTCIFFVAEALCLADRHVTTETPIYALAWTYICEGPLIPLAWVLLLSRIDQLYVLEAA
jgi:hypothetical protein